MYCNNDYAKPTIRPSEHCFYYASDARAKKYPRCNRYDYIQSNGSAFFADRIKNLSAPYVIVTHSDHRPVCHRKP